MNQPPPLPVKEARESELINKPCPLQVLYEQPTGRLALVFELMDMNIYELIRGRRQYETETSTPQPKPETRNPKPETRNPKPETSTRNPKPETSTPQHPKHPKPETRNLNIPTPETS